MRFDDYYQTELTALRELGRELGTAQPSLAGMLAEAGSDPDVERLLQGFAFLAARVRQRLDDAAPPLIEGLAELVLPQLLRPTPAVSLVQVDLGGAALRSPQTVAAGSRIHARPVEGTRCTFTTTRPLALLPLRLVEQTLDQTNATAPTLTLRFALEPGVSVRALGGAALRLHVHAEPATASQLALWFARHVSEVALETSAGESLALSPSSIVPLAPCASDPLVPVPRFAPEAPLLIDEYFLLPAKLLFVDLLALSTLPASDATSFTLRIRFSRPPPLPAPLPLDALRLHCVPVVNVFAQAGDPVRQTGAGRPVLLRAGALDPRHAEVFDVVSVTGVSPRGERRAYQLFSGGFAPRDEHRPSYRTTRASSPIDAGTQTYLEIVRASPTAREDEVLALDLLCTNRALPSALRAGDLDTPSADLPSGVSVTNIEPVTRPGAPPLGMRSLWQLLSHVGWSRRSLGDREALRGLLSARLAACPLSDPARRAGQARIDAIRSVRAVPTARVVGRVATAGTRYEIELAESAFSSEGELYLFGTVLHRLLASDARVNAFASLVCTSQPSGATLRFEPEAQS